MKKWFLLLVLVLSLVMVAGAQEESDFVYGDPLPDAPELAERGTYAVGVRELSLVDAERIDLLSATEEDPSPLYDRTINVHVWYPAALAEGQEQSVEYTDVMGRADNPNAPLTPFTFEGRAAIDADPDASGAPYPLVIVSHGFPGSSLMMTYLTENLASKGYVVVAIDHTESTFEDVAGFGSTLLNRSQDQWFMVDEMARLSASDDSFLAGLVDAENTGLIGYSMGGYGALNALGAGYNGVAANFGPGANYELLVDGNPAYAELVDPRIKAAVLFAPWGGSLAGLGMGDTALWDEPALANITAPTFWVVGSQDDVSLFSGVRRLFDWSVNSDRYLLVYENALHNVAPNPPPADAEAFPDYERYSEPVWEETRINNINQHFVTAFLGYYLKGDEALADYLMLEVENANDGVYSVAEDGSFTEEHTYWAGFTPRTALGMQLIYAPAAE